MKLGTKTFSALLVAIFLFSVVGETAVPVAAQEGPPVLAFYYAWFDQNTWTSGQSSDLPVEPYASVDRSTIERHVRQAQGAGINAFIQSWYGPQEANNQTEINFRTLLDVAGATGFKAAVDFEVTGPFFGDAGAVTSALASLLSTHAQHPAYLRYQGKPVIFFWRQQRFSVEEWLAFRNQVDPNQDSFWIAEGVDIAYQAVFDGHHLYSIAWAGSPAGELAKWRDRVQAYEAENEVDRLWVATTMPGYDDTRLPRDDAFTVPRRNGDYYRETWQGAVASQPDMIVITSFNEWLEGTHIEPSANYGNLYLDVTRELVTNLRGSPPAAPAAVPVAAEALAVQELAVQEPSVQDSPDDTEAPAAVPETNLAQQPSDEPYITTESITNVRSGPSTDLEVVGRLGIEAFAPVIGRNEAGDWWQIEFEAGEDGNGWVAAEVVEFVGDSSQVPVAEAPTDTDVVEPAIDLPTVEIPVGGINVRSGPSLDFDLLGRLDEGQSVAITGQSEARDWWQIVFEPGEDERGWITAALIDFSGDASTVPVVTVLSEGDIFPTPTIAPTVPTSAGRIEVTDAINVRAEPSTEGTIVGGLYLGDAADVFAVSEDRAWWQIEFFDGPEGLAWVAAEFVRFQGDQAQVPIFGAGPPTPTPTATGIPSPTAVATNTPTPPELDFPPTFAPTATSIYDATAAAAVENRGTPDPGLIESTEDPSSFDISQLPWGIVSLILVVGLLWFYFSRRRSSRF